MRLIAYGTQDRCFEFDPQSGAYSHLELPEVRKGLAGYSGAGQLLRSLGEGTVFVAKYRLADDGWFSIGAEKWALFDESLVIRHDERWIGLVCELSVHRDGRCIRKFRYWRRDWFAMIIDSAYDQLDFSLAHLPVDFEPGELSSLEKQRADFIAMWSES